MCSRNFQISTIKNRRLRNLLRGAISNTNERTRKTTLSNARHQLSSADASAFAQILLYHDLDKTIYGAPFPQTPTHLYTKPRSISPVPLSIEIRIQLSRFTFHNELLLDCIKSIILINQTILSRQLNDAVLYCETHINNFGYSVTIIRKLIYLSSQIVDHTDDNHHNGPQHRIRLLIERLNEYFVSPAMRQYITFLIDLFDMRYDLFETIHEHARTHAIHFSDNSQFPFSNSLLTKTRYPCLPLTLSNPYCFFHFSCGSLIDSFIDLVCLQHCAASPTLNDTIASSAFFRSAKGYLPLFDTIHDGFLTATDDANYDSLVYRLASALPEHAPLSAYRRAVDTPLLIRDNISQPTAIHVYSYFSSDININDIAIQSNGPIQQVHSFDPHNTGVTTRSFALLH